MVSDDVAMAIAPQLEYGHCSILTAYIFMKRWHHEKVVSAHKIYKVGVPTRRDQLLFPSKTLISEDVLRLVVYYMSDIKCCC